MVKVLVISSSTVFRGAEQVLVDTLPHLSDFSIRILSAKDNVQLESGVEGIPGIQYLNTKRMGNWGAGHGGGIVPKLKKLLNYLLGCGIVFSASRKADIVVGNNTGDVIYSVFSWLARRPFVLHCHDDSVSGEHRLMLKIFSPFVSRYMAVSHSVNRMLEKLVRNSVVDVVHNGLPHLECNEPQERAGDIRICWIGAIEKRKDPIAFLELVKHLQTEGFQVSAAMAFRESDRELLDSMKHMISQFELPVDLLGAIDRDDIHQLISSHDWLVITSVSDPLPTVVLESYRAGRPVIANDIDSLRSMVVDGETGLIYETGKPASLKRLSERISTFSLHSGRIKARKRFEESYSISVKVEKVTGIFNALAKESP